MTVTLTLGGVAFNDFEVPESINSGGDQMLVAHKLIGGARVVDSMGPDDADIHWTGRFRGNGAEQRAMLLDFMRRQGQQVLLTYSLHRYQVVIKHFEANFQQPFEIPYSISCTVVLDEAQGIASAAIGLLESLLTDMANALGLGNVIGNSVVISAVSGVAAAVSNYQAGVPTTTSIIAGTTALVEAPLLTAVQTAITGAQSATTSAINTTSSQVTAQPAVAGSVPTSIANNLMTTASSLVSLSNLYQLSNTLGRMAVNLTNTRN